MTLYSVYLTIFLIISSSCRMSDSLQQKNKIKGGKFWNKLTSSVPFARTRSVAVEGHRVKRSIAVATSVIGLSISPLIPDKIVVARADDMTTVIESPTEVKEAFDPKKAAEFVASVEKLRPLHTDEFTLTFEKESLGLGLTESIYKVFPIVTVNSIKGAELVVDHPELRIGAIITAVNDARTDGLPLTQISEMIKSSPRPVNLRFRDPSRYFEQLDSTAGPPLRVITSSYLPANARDAGASEQVIKVERLEMPAPEDRTRAAQLLDVMEIQYVAQLPNTQEIVDSSAARAPPGTSAGSIYYVLGQRNGPPGKFPPGWDLTLRGMVVGEKRRITLPYTLAYDRAGSKDKKIPPFATVIYTVRLVSLT